MGDLSWTAYSDKADLPMSTQWREELKAQLSKIDTEKLDAKQKAQFKKLWRRLNGDDEEPVSLFENYVPWLIIGGAAIAYYVWSTQQTNNAGGSVLGGPTPIPVGG